MSLSLRRYKTRGGRSLQEEEEGAIRVVRIVSFFFSRYQFIIPPYLILRCVVTMPSEMHYRGHKMGRLGVPSFGIGLLLGGQRWIGGRGRGWKVKKLRGGRVAVDRVVRLL